MNKHILVGILCLLTLQVFANYNDHQVISFRVTSDHQAQELIRLGELAPNFSLWNEHISLPGDLTLQVHSETVPYLLKFASGMGISYEFIHQNLQQDIDALFEANEIIKRRADSNFFDAYATYDQMQAFLNTLASNYSSLASLVNVGTTIEGRQITGIVISGANANAPSIVMNGCQHAREWISPMTVAYLAQSLLQGYSTDSSVKSLVDNFVWTVIPIVNADGYEYTWNGDRMWRKNRRQNVGTRCYGVDINRNWGYKWGTGGSSSVACADTYMGPSAFSEPENAAVANYITKQGNTVAYIDFHAYGALFMYPWGWTCTEQVANNATQSSCSSDYAKAVKSVNGLTFTTGPICNTIYLASGGSNDWTYGDANVPYSFACELRGNSFILPPEEILPSGRETWAGVKAMGQYILKNN